MTSTSHAIPVRPVVEESLMNRVLNRSVSFAMFLSLLVSSTALAGRGGFHGGGGGFHAGGGGFHPAAVHPGGFGAPAAHPGGFSAPAFHGSPAADAPRTINNFGRGGAPISHPANVASANVNRHGGYGWRGPYGGYHSGWVHGYWNGHYWPGGYGYGYGYPGYGWGLAGAGLGGFGLGLGLGAGIGAWGYGSSLYNWGYSNYANPYYVNIPVAVGQPVAAFPYDYSQPIDTQAAPPQEAVSDEATQAFDAAREAFKAGDNKQALALVDQALKNMPNDPTLHEFRALVLFALGQYEQAAVPLYAVLSNGPGWDWTTMVSLYPGVDVYTAQLRALEDYTLSQQNSVAGHFVLAYHYLTQGHTVAATGQLQRVVALQPGDTLSAQLLRQLSQTGAPAAGTDPAGAQPQPQSPAQTVATAGAPEGTLVGNWSAIPSKDIAIQLAISPDGNFTWKVTNQGQSRQFTGTSTSGNGLLTLAQSQGPPMVGRVTWRDLDHFTFQLAGGPDDPGLSFSRSR
jgi:tetratricopeptide (TPR) repeat protein